MNKSNGNFRPAVFVTGALTGIGQVAAGYLSRRGFRVFAGVLASSSKNGPSEDQDGIVLLPLDVTRPEMVAESASQVAFLAGEQGLQGLVNNAAIYHQSPLECIDICDLRKHLEVNLVGNIAVTQAFLPLLRK